MACPMRPSPMNPTFMLIPSCFGGGILQARIRRLEAAANVRVGSKANACGARADVRYESEADIRPRRHVLLSIERFAGARSQELAMADESTEIEISSTNEDGHTISGSYWVAAETIHVTLSDGTTGEAPLGNTP